MSGQKLKPQELLLNMQLVVCVVVDVGVVDGGVVVVVLQILLKFVLKTEGARTGVFLLFFSLLLFGSI